MSEQPTPPKKAEKIPLPFKEPSKDGKFRTGLYLLNSMAGDKSEFIPNNKGRGVTWYACGPTTYDAAHMGHARNYVMFDTLLRLMEDYFGYDVRLCMNVTDVDDKIIAKANEQKVEFRDIARKWEMAFWEDMASFGVRLPDVITRVSEYIEEIIDYIKKIIENGYAYESNGSVYFDIEAFSKNKNHFYSRMDPSRAIDVEAILEGEGALGAQAAGGDKRGSRDFALWKKAKENEPSWESPWGRGRPGWHIECSAMASNVFDFPLDIHSGGIDLKFPHHTNELAQSEAYYDQPQWVNYFVHSGHLHIDGCKMSKSLKNFIVIKECIKDIPARQWRIMFALNRWHAPMNYDPTGTSVNEATAVDKKFANFFSNIKATIRDLLKPTLDSIGKRQKWNESEKKLNDTITQCETEVHEHLCNNLNTVDVLTCLGNLVSSINGYIAVAQKDGSGVCGPIVLSGGKFIHKILRCMGMAHGPDDELAYGSLEAPNTDNVAPVMDILCEYRANIKRDAIKMMKAKEIGDAKAIAKDLLSKGDALRDDSLPAIGIKLEDTPQGSVWRV